MGGPGVGRGTMVRRAALSGASALLFLLSTTAAHAGPLEDAVSGLASPSEDRMLESIRKLGALEDARAWPALDALCDSRLRVGNDGKPYIWDSKTHDARDPLTLT